MSSSEFGAKTAEPMVGEVTALRSFRLTDDGYLLPLTDAGGYEPWPTTTSSAKCNRGRSHSAPDPDCTCGFYAYGNRGWVEAEGQYLWSRVVLAAVHCSGRLVAGEKGLRAEKVRLVACYVNKHAPTEVLEALREHYPEVEFHQSRKSLLSAHPETHLSTYIDPPRIRSGVRILPMILALLAVPFLGATVALNLWGGQDLTTTRLSGAIFAVLVWSPFLIEGISLLTLKMSPDSLGTIRRITQRPWDTRRRTYLTSSPVPRILVMGMALAFLFTTPSVPLNGGWPVLTVVLMAAATLVVIWLEARKIFPLSKAFPLVPRTGAVRSLRDSLASPPEGRDRLQSVSLVASDLIAEMHDMRGHGVGMVHFGIVSDPADHPSAENSASELAKTLKMAAASMGLKRKQWVAYIASGEDRLRVLTSAGQVSPPIPLAEIDAILPLPTLAWCPPDVRPSLVWGLRDHSLDPETAPYTLPARYRGRKEALGTFSDPRVEDALRIARRLTEQAAYRDFKKDQARLPEGLAPVAVPVLPSEGGTVIEGASDDVWTIAQALATLLDSTPDSSSTRGLAFAIGELMDGLNTLGGADEVVTFDASGEFVEGHHPDGAEFDMRAAHILLAGTLDITLSAAVKPISFTSPEGRVYMVFGMDKKVPQCATLTLRTSALERGRGDDGDSLGDARQ